MDERDPDRPLPPDDRFAVEARRFVEGRPDPSQNVHPPGNAPMDVMRVLEGEEQLDRIIG